MSESEKHENLNIIRSSIGGEIEDLIVAIWERTRLDWGYLKDSLSSVFRENKGLGSSERRLVAESIYGMVRHKRRLETALKSSKLRNQKSEARARLYGLWLLEMGLQKSDLDSVDHGMRLEDVLSVDERISKLKKLEQLAIGHSLPDFLAEKLLTQYGDDAFLLAASLNHRAPMTIRVNTLLTSREECASQIREEGFGVSETVRGDQGLVFDDRTNLFALSGFKKGHFEAQDEGSQLIAELCAPPPKSHLVDYCAGAGGKSLAIAALLKNKGRISAFDIHAKKLSELKRRAKRAGVDNISTHAIPEDPNEAWPPKLEKSLGQAKRVLVDAPCSGIGSLRRHPESKWRLTEENLNRLPKIQSGILERAWDIVSPGGRLIYATCTLLAEENEDVVNAFQGKHKDAKSIHLGEILGSERKDIWCDDKGHGMKLFPHIHGTDGFYAMVWRKQK